LRLDEKHSRRDATRDLEDMRPEQEEEETVQS